MQGLQSQISESAERKEQNEDEKDQNEIESSNSSDVDYYADDKPLPKSEPFDLKKLWLGETEKLLKEFDIKYEEVKNSQNEIQNGFKAFAQNEQKYKISSLRKINIDLTNKQIYNEFILKSRKTIETLNPILVLNILSYLDHHLFRTLIFLRKVCRSFNTIYLNDHIQTYLAEKDFLYSGPIEQARQISVQMCKKYVQFLKTFLYYKEMQYCEQIPQNSITKDFEESVNFINEVHRMVILKNTKNFYYFELINSFMIKNRVSIGLSSLSLTSLVMVRKAAIIAFSNFLAFNQEERSKEQITKTKYSKVISVVENEDYQSNLIINTKVSNYLQQFYEIDFAVLTTPTSKKGILNDKEEINILVYHLHDEGKTHYFQNVELNEHFSYESEKVIISFNPSLEECTLNVKEFVGWTLGKSTVRIIDTIIRKQRNNEMESEDLNMFSFCYFYQIEQYFVILLPNHDI